MTLLQSLHEMGFRLALDDFGTGYSSLSRLRQLPFSTLKIDKSFVDGVAEDSDDRTIVLSTMQLARNLGIAPLAEGVETWPQRSFLVDHGCSLGQGYLFCPPLAPEALTARLARVPFAAGPPN
jgi:EAL domain-containing protein (putative c-di-GMP-specific phosphodiesterase class I)